MPSSPLEEYEPSSSTSSTSTSSSASTVSDDVIRVPGTKRENRLLKAGYAEADNAPIGYVRMPLIVPSILFAAVSFSSFVAAVVLGYRETEIPTDEQMRRGILLSYGFARIYCNTTVPFPHDGMPSLLNIFEMTVSGNIFFRIAVCIPIVLRIFQSLCLRDLARTAQKNGGSIFEVTTDLLPALTGMECLALSLFSIVTMHTDFANANRVFKLCFAISSTLNMMSTTIVMFNFRSRTRNRLDSLSLGAKMVTSFAYCYLSPTYFQRAHTASLQPMCHAYIPRTYACIEYVLVVCYAVFHLSWLIDVRDIYFLCYPRSCSGECEPLDPANFARGGKYEYCRAFEARQRQLARHKAAA